MRLLRWPRRVRAFEPIQLAADLLQPGKQWAHRGSRRQPMAAGRGGFTPGGIHPIAELAGQTYPLGSDVRGGISFVHAGSSALE
jgi:hypothetical protein